MVDVTKRPLQENSSSRWKLESFSPRQHHNQAKDRDMLPKFLLVRKKKKKIEKNVMIAKSTTL